jgi:hypothetical protein
MTIPVPPAPPAPSAPVSEPAKPASWWRSNRLALIALAVLAPATVLGVGWHEWYQYYGYGARPYIPVAVDDDESAELAGATWGPVRGGELDDITGLDVPAGATVIAVGVPVDPEAKGVGCMSPVLVDQQTGREWKSARSEIGLLSHPDEPEICVSDTAAPYELILPFVVPDDVEGPFWVDIAPYNAGGSFVRFSLER